MDAWAFLTVPVGFHYGPMVNPNALANLIGMSKVGVIFDYAFNYFTFGRLMSKPVMPCPPKILDVISGWQPKEINAN